MRNSTRIIGGSALVAVMTAAAAVSLTVMDDWIGDWGAALWVCSGFFFPFMAGIAWGPGGGSAKGRVVGALLGALVVLAPGIGYALARDPDLAELRLPLLWSVFAPLAMAQGAITLPVGASARKRRAS